MKTKNRPAYIFHWIRKNFLFSVNLPTGMSAGPRAVPTPDGNGVIIILDKKMFKLVCNEESCTWTKLSQELSVSRIQWFQAMYIPEEMTNCN